MGAGSFGAGVGLAGHDPVETAEPVVIAAGLGAARFDPLTKTYPVADDGEVEQVDAVWQEVAHRLGIPLGALASTPDVGIDLERIRAATREQAQRTVEDVIAVALKPMIERGDVAVARVVLAQPWRGKWESWIVNLRDPRSKPRPFGAR